MTKPLDISDSLISHKIFLVRDRKVMLDEDLAALYGVETKRLNEQVKRNMDRFPNDFMFQLTKKELEILKSQIATSRWGGRRNLPYTFTEHGVLMLSSVLKSKKAIAVNIQIMRLFTKMRQMMFTEKDLLLKLNQIEQEVKINSKEIQILFEYFKKLISHNKAKGNQSQRRKIGFE